MRVIAALAAVGIALFLVVKMIKYLLFITLLIAGLPSAALAQMSGYLGADGYFSIRGLQANKSYSINLGGMPLIRAGNSNSCGILRIANNTQVHASDKIEIHDVKANKYYGFENNSSIPIKEFKCITGQVKPEREIWKDNQGTIWISGLSPSSAQTIRLLSSNPTRKIRANPCGFISLKLGNPQPLGLIIDNNAFSISGATAGGGIVCRRGKLYVGYPPQPTINPVSATQWRTQNQINFQAYTSIASIAGGGTNWSDPPSSPPPPGSGNACTVGVNCEEPPPPPPPTCPESTIGTPPNCVTPPPPPPPEEPPPPPPKPQPSSGQKMCKYSGSLVVIGLPPNKELVAYASERHRFNDRFTTSDSGGWAQFDNFNFAAEYEGEPASVGIQYKKDNGDWENVNAYFVYIPSIGPCQN